jgi:hypothetical protein
LTVIHNPERQRASAEVLPIEDAGRLTHQPKIQTRPHSPVGGGLSNPRSSTHHQARISAAPPPCQKSVRGRPPYWLGRYQDPGSRLIAGIGSPRYSCAAHVWFGLDVSALKAGRASCQELAKSRPRILIRSAGQV